MQKKWKDNFWSPEAIVQETMKVHLKEGERGIKKIYFLPFIDGTPARCLRSTGECWVSLKHWNKLKKEHKIFILLHENEHILQNTSDELKVDDGAHRKYMRMGYSLTESVKALTQVLSFKNEEHTLRARAQMARAIAYDITQNGNLKLKQWLFSSDKLKP